MEVAQSTARPEFWQRFRDFRLFWMVESLETLYANRWIRYVMTLFLVALVAWRVHPERLSGAVASARPGFLLPALALTIPFLYLKSLRWYVMLREAGVRAGFGEAAMSLVGGMGLALLTPARLGELVRAAYLRDGQKLKIGGLVMIDKAFDVLVLAGLSIAGAWVLIGIWAGLALAGATVIGLLAAYHPRPVMRALERVGASLPLQSKTEQIWSSMEALSPWNTTTYVVLTALSFAVVLVQFGLVLLSWRGWSLDIVFLTFPLVVLTNVLPITIGGLGVREGAAAVLLAHYGVSPAHAVLAAFLMFFMNTALPGLLGAVILPVSGARVAGTAQLENT